MTYSRQKISIRRLLQREGVEFERGLNAEIGKYLESIEVQTNPNTVKRYVTGSDLKQVSLDFLGGIVKYLKSEKKVASDLPSGLLYEDALWDIWCDLKTTFFVGFHSTPGPELEDGKTLRDQWISPRDHHAQSTLASQLASKLAAKLPRSHENKIPNLISEQFVEFSRDKEPNLELTSKAKAVFEEYFQDLAGKSGREALTARCIIGSPKVMNLASNFVANIYGHEDPLTPSDLSNIPFFIVPRKSDFGFVSCFGGREPPAFIQSKDPKPGIYYKRAGSWENTVSWLSQEQDAGLVLIRYSDKLDVLDVLLFGFSGRGTLALANHVIEHGEKFWPLGHESEAGSFGAFICTIPLPKVDAPESVDLYRGLDVTVLPI